MNDLSTGTTRVANPGGPADLHSGALSPDGMPASGGRGAGDDSPPRDASPAAVPVVPAPRRQDEPPGPVRTAAHAVGDLRAAARMLTLEDNRLAAMRRRGLVGPEVEKQADDRERAGEVLYRAGRRAASAVARAAALDPRAAPDLAAALELSPRCFDALADVTRSLTGRTYPTIDAAIFGEDR